MRATDRFPFPAILVLAAVAATPLKSQDGASAPPTQLPAVAERPAAVTKTLWWGYRTCTATTPGSNSAPYLNCDGSTGVSTSGAPTTIAVGDSVKIDSGTMSNHDIEAGTTVQSGFCNAAPANGGSSQDASVPGFMPWISTPTFKFSDYSAGTYRAYVIQFNKPGVYWLYCDPHNGTQISRIEVTPLTQTCKVGSDTSACQNPLLQLNKIQAGQTILQATGMVTVTQGVTGPAYFPTAPADSVVLSWSGASTARRGGIGGAVRIFRSTKPDFSQNPYEPTNPNRMYCAPNWSDATTPPVIVGQPQIFYYKVCDSGGGPACADD